MYNKIFTKILDSSIWLESNTTRIAWMTMLAAMDETGFCPFAAVGNFAARARITKEEAIEALRVLESPDAESGDPDNEGRRVERVPGGWIVLNAVKYRELVSRAVIQEQTRKRVARHRAAKAKPEDVTQCNAPVTLSNELVTPSRAEAEAEAEADGGDARGNANAPSAAAGSAEPPAPTSGPLPEIKTKRVPRPIDDVWLAELGQDPAFAGIDVKTEFSKASRWCMEKGLKLSRMRLINWLNRADRAMTTKPPQPTDRYRAGWL